LELRIYRAAQLAHPQDYVVAMSLAGRLFAITGSQHAEGEHFYRLAQALRPDLAAPLLYLAWEFEHRDLDCAAAVELDLRAAELEPDNRVVYFLLGRALRCVGDFDGSLSAMKHVNRLRGFENESVQKEIATLYRTEHRYDEALAEYRKVLSIAPHDINARYEYAETFADVGHLDEALEELERTLADDPNASFVSVKATFLIERGDGDEAARIVRESLDTELEAVLRLRTMDARLSDFVELEPLITLVTDHIAREPEDAAAYCRLGALLEASGRFGAALVAYQTGHALGSRQPGWSHPSARWLAQAERFATLEARASLTSKPPDPRDAEEAYSLAIIAARQERWSSAAQAFATTFERDPSRASVGLARVEAAAAALELARTLDANGAVGADAQQAADWRARALTWMRADIDARREEVECGDSLASALRGLAAWRAARELSSVRDADRLRELSVVERTAWQSAWSDLGEVADHALRGRATARR
jgi:tetratricopeptide (TPR) repeat protein